MYGSGLRSLAGIPAVVTGASRGIGAAVARTLAALGAPVAVAYRSEEEAAQKVVAAIEADEGRAAAFRVDVSSWVEVDRLFRRVEHELGSPGILVNNAGIHRGGRIASLALSDWDAVLATDLTGAFLCARRAVPGMLEREWGRIVNVSSIVGLKGFPGDTPYAAAKAGLLGLTKALALELAPEGVTVNALCPGFVETDMTRGLSARALERANAGIPLGRQADAQEIADATAFLVAGPGYITGSTLVVDGGWLLA
ncbi:MAG: 3-oxoacyl-ACP reductase family protein [Actinomycetota bacterium]